MPTSSLLLRAALLSGTEARDAFQSWQSVIDLDNLPPGQSTLSPLLYRNLQSLNIDHPWLPRLKGLYRRSWYANQLALRTLDAVINVLNASGTPTRIMGGAALARNLYPEAALRPIQSLEILVPPAMIGDALHQLQAAGWQRQPPFLAFEQIPCWLPGQRLTGVQGLTLLLMWTALPDAPDAGRELERRAWAKPRLLAHSNSPTLDSTSQLVHACLAAADGGLIHLVDAAVLIRQNDIDWPWLSAIAQQHRLGLPLAQALSSLVETRVVAIPAPVLQELEQIPARNYERRSWQAGLIPPPQRTLLQRIGRRYARYRRTLDYFDLAPGLRHWIRSIRPGLRTSWPLIERQTSHDGKDSPGVAQKTALK